MNADTLLAALAKAAAALSSAESAYAEIRALVESVRGTLAETDRGRIDEALKVLQNRNDEDFERVGARLKAGRDRAGSAIAAKAAMT